MNYVAFVHLGQSQPKMKKKVEIRELSVTQSNPLIEATYPRTIQSRNGSQEIDGKVTTRAHKVARLIVSLINPEDKDLRLYRIDIATLKSYLGYKEGFPNGRFYQDLKDIAHRLNKQPIEIRPEPKRILTAYFISSFEINYKTGEVIFEISGQLKPFLMELKKNFTSFDLENIPRLSSGYSIRLYELLCQYKPLGKRTFHDLDQLQLMIGSAYDKYSHFKARVLEPTRKDITKNTNITFEYEELKTGKKVTSLAFKIGDNVPETAVVPKGGTLLFTDTEGAKIGEKTTAAPNGLLQILINAGIKTKAAALYVQMGFNIVKNEVKRGEAQNRCTTIEAYYAEKATLLSNAKTENPAGFIVKALQEDWHTNKATQAIEEQKAVRENQQRQRQVKQLEKQLDSLKSHYQTAIEPIFERLAADEKTFLEAYAGVMNQYDAASLFSRGISQFPTARAAYQGYAALRSLMNEYNRKHFPAEFAVLNTFLIEMEGIKKEIAVLKK